MNLTNTSTNKIDVLIIGAGPVGLAAATWFAKENHTVVVVEQYAEVKSYSKRAFNERHQQVGLNPNTLSFLHELNVVIWGKVKQRGCPQDDWINIPIYMLQDIFYKEIKTVPNLKLLFNAKIESVNSSQAHKNARVIVVANDLVYSFQPELIIVADGKQDAAGTAKTFFNFPAASKVTLSTYGIIGLIKRDSPANLCLVNYSADNYVTPLGTMHVRLLGSLQERYIALGLTDGNNLFAGLTAEQIYQLLADAYTELRDPHEPEFTGFSEYSTAPIPIVLDYRKETIKILEPSNTIVSVEGDAARKTTFFSGSGLNSAYAALVELFKFAKTNRKLIFNSTDLLLIDEQLLEKDRAALNVTLELLKKGISYITSSQKNCCNASTVPVITKVSPQRCQINSFVQIKGSNLVKNGAIPDVLIGNILCRNVTSSVDKLKVRVPSNLNGTVNIALQYDKIVIPLTQTIEVVKVEAAPVISEVKIKETFIKIKGDNFVHPCFVYVDDLKVRAYCSSVTNIKFPLSAEYKGQHNISIETALGKSNSIKFEF